MMRARLTTLLPAWWLLSVPAWGASLTVGDLVLDPGTSGVVVVSGSITGESTFGYTIQVEIVPRSGNLGTVTFSVAPPADVVQVGDPWPSVGTFSPFDTDLTGSILLNGAVDDNGSFVPGALTFSGPLVEFPVVASADAAGVWDVVLSTSAGASNWEGLGTTLFDGIIVVTPDASLTAEDLLMPPGAVSSVLVSGAINGVSTFGVTVQVELLPRVGNTGTVTFTPAPPVDVVQRGDPWPGVGAFQPFDTNASGSTMLNGSVDDNGTFVPGPIVFSGLLTEFPVVSSVDATGIWDIVLATSAGDSSWEGLPTFLLAGTLTIDPGACTTGVDCDDADPCTDDVCNGGACGHSFNTDPCDDGDPCTTGDVCAAGTCAGSAVDCSSLDDDCNDGVCNPTTGLCETSPINEGLACDDANPCTLGDTCASGACLGTLVDCASLDDACNQGTCNVATGLCEPAPINEGLTCDDGDLCTTGDICASGTCTGIPVDCSGLDDACNAGVCNAATGICDATPTNEGGPCDDGQACTVNDACASGACAGTPVSCPPGQLCDPADGVCKDCLVNADCDDANVCTDDTCVGGACQYTNNVLLCDDSNPCTQSDVCSGGVCGGTPVSCPPGQVCDPADGLCKDCVVDADCDDANACTDDTCVAGACQHADNTDPCDDGALCTQGDVCGGGGCAGTPVSCPPGQLCDPADGVCKDCLVDVDCDDANLCTDDACVANVCQHTNNVNPCNDGLFCTLTDMCSGGVCVGSGDSCPGQLCDETADACVNCLDNTDCDDGNLCTDDACVGGLCQNSNNTIACDDGNLCTTGDACSGGACAGTPVDCTGLDDDCNQGTCNPATGACEAVTVNEGGVCDDGDLCTEFDECISGLCAGVPLDCSVLDDTCNLGVCNPSTGLCEPSPANEGGACDDGDLCTTGDACAFGACAGTPVDCTGLDDACNSGVCNTSTGLCEAQTINEGGACDDGDLCTLNDVCVSGVCSGTPVDCSGLNGTCTVGACDPADGSCVSLPANEGLVCDDGSLCTTNDRCQSGVCVGDSLQGCSECAINADCDDGNVCTQDTCHPVGVCVHSNIVVACDDLDPCTENDVCSEGVCSGDAIPGCVNCGVAADCDDGNICTTDACVGGVCSYTDNDGIVCDDNNICTTDDRCSSGVCAGIPLIGCDVCTTNADCNDGNVCTNDVCHAVGVCTYPNNSNPCSDGDPCTGNDTCANGVCSGTPKNDGDACDDGSICTTAETCQSGLCVGVPDNEGAACDDLDLCTENDECASGVCAGTPIDCTSLDTDCLQGQCNASTGACEAVVVNESGPCEDGDPCTVNDTCAGGSCSGSPKDCSFLDNFCGVGACFPTDGACVVAPINEGASCDDGSLCTSNDSCRSGVCTGDAVTCPDTGDPCTASTCNPANGICEFGPANDGASCDDGDLCTTNDQCTTGTCVGTPVDCSFVSDACNSGSCNPTNGACVASPTNEGGACDDGDPCTVGDSCASGVCSGVPQDCSSLDDSCNVGVCNAATGICEPSPVNNGGPCDDGNPCTLSDACNNGTCTGTPRDCSGLDTTCAFGQCNTSTGLCEAIPRNEGASCTSANLCELNKTCSSGSCVGTPKNCSAFDGVCTVGTCNPPTGSCFAAPANEGGACDDGYSCTTGDSCSGGVCEGTPSSPRLVDLEWSPSAQTIRVGTPFSVSLVARSTTCIIEELGSLQVILNWDPTRIRLDGKTDNGPFTWASSSFPNDSALDGLNAPFSGVPSNDGDALYLAIAGLSGGAPAGPSGLVVTTFNFTALSLATSGTPLSIGATAGNFTETIVLAFEGANQELTGGLGTTLISVVECITNSQCDDGNVCTTDTCSGGLCGHSNNTMPCNDGLFCTLTDTCSGGVCVGSGNTCPGQQCNETLNACVECLNNSHCNDGNLCTTDSCDASGNCVFTNNSLSCNDGNFCTATDQCSGGSCVGSGTPCTSGRPFCDENLNVCLECLSAADCNDGNICTTDSCDASGTCVHTNNTLTCNDGLFCTVTDTCSGGVCQGTGTPCSGQFCSETLDACVDCLNNTHCNDGNPCTSDFCTQGVCTHNNVSGGCSDGLFCTTSGTCSGGVCIGSGDACPGQLCDEANDRCVECFDDSDCDDNIPCTTDSCDTVTGDCIHQPDNAVCADGLFCTGAEFCDPVQGCVSPGDPCGAPGLCDEAGDFCHCEAPAVQESGPRYVMVEPAASTTPVAIRFDFAAAGRPSCGVLYVSADGRLTPTPVFQTPSAWGTVFVGDLETEPNRAYAIQSDCRNLPTDPQNLSPTVFTFTTRWGDLNGSGVVDVDDILMSLFAFTSDPSAGQAYFKADLEGCLPNGVVDVDDVLAVLGAFRSVPFHCPAQCP